MIPSLETDFNFVFKKQWGVPVVVQWLTNPTRNHEVAGSIPALAQEFLSLAQWLTNPTRNHEVAGSTPGLTQRVKDPPLL